MGIINGAVLLVAVTGYALFWLQALLDSPEGGE